MSTLNNKSTVLDQVVVLNLGINIWSGRKKLREVDLKLPSGAELPPSNLASLGSKRICDPNEIKVFERLKRQAVRRVEETGIKFLGGHAIPIEKAKSLIDEIEDIRQEFLMHKNSFLRRYDGVIRNWISLNDEWKDVITSAVTPVDVVKSRIDFTQSVYQITPVEGVDDQLNDHVMSMSDQLYFEISKEAQELIDRSIVPRNDNTATQRIIKPIMRMRDKLDGLKFLDSNVNVIIDHLESVIAEMPKTGQIKGKEYTSLFTLLVTLSDKNTLKALGKGLSNQQINHHQSTFVQPFEDVNNTSFAHEETIDNSVVQEELVKEETVNTDLDHHQDTKEETVEFVAENTTVNDFLDNPQMFEESVSADDQSFDDSTINNEALIPNDEQEVAFESPVKPVKGIPELDKTIQPQTEKTEELHKPIPAPKPSSAAVHF